MNAFTRLRLRFIQWRATRMLRTLDRLEKKVRLNDEVKAR